MIRPWLSDDDVPAVEGPDDRPVRDPLREEAERRFDTAGDEPWFRVEATTTVQDWQRLFDLFAKVRPRGGRWWRYAEGGVERDLPATAAEVFARPPGAPLATVRQVFVPEDSCPITFHLTTPQEICFTVDLRSAAQRRSRALGESLEHLVLALPRACCSWLPRKTETTRSSPCRWAAPGCYEWLPAAMS